jgi:hypothetical protein
MSRCSFRCQVVKFQSLTRKMDRTAVIIERNRFGEPTVASIWVRTSILTYKSVVVDARKPFRKGAVVRFSRPIMGQTRWNVQGKHFPNLVSSEALLNNFLSTRAAVTSQNWKMLSLTLKEDSTGALMQIDLKRCFDLKSVWS